MGSDTSGYSVVDAGTLLAIQKGGILAVPYGDQNVLATKYEGGTMHAPSSMALLGRKSIMGKFGKEQTTHLFQVGDKVYADVVAAVRLGNLQDLKNLQSSIEETIRNHASREV